MQLTDREKKALSVAETQQKMGANFRKPIQGYYMCRQVMGANGYYQDETYIHPRGYELLFVVPATEARKAEKKWRMLTMAEYKKWHTLVNECEEDIPKDVLQRELNELKEKVKEQAKPSAPVEALKILKNKELNAKTKAKPSASAEALKILKG